MWDELVTHLGIATVRTYRPALQVAQRLVCSLVAFDFIGSMDIYDFVGLAGKLGRARSEVVTFKIPIVRIYALWRGRAMQSMFTTGERMSQGGFRTV